MESYTLKAPFQHQVSFDRSARFARPGNIPVLKSQIKAHYGNGHGIPEKSMGPPRPASASSRLIMTAIAVSSLLSDGIGFGDSSFAVPIMSIMSSSGDAPERTWIVTLCVISLTLTRVIGLYWQTESTLRSAWSINSPLSRKKILLNRSNCSHTSALTTLSLSLFLSLFHGDFPIFLFSFSNFGERITHQETTP